VKSRHKKPVNYVDSKSPRLTNGFEAVKVQIFLKIDIEFLYVLMCAFISCELRPHAVVIGKRNCVRARTQLRRCVYE
jgi:hypothetical protein